MPGLTLYLLGPPRVERDEVAIEVDTRKAIALIAYLAITRQRHSRDALAALLWPENPQSSARAALRRTLSALNKAIDGDWLEVDRDSVGLLRRPEIWIDVDQFRGLLAECRAHGHPESEVCRACVRPLSQASALYRDDFLAGFTLRDSSNFDDWQFFQGEGLRRELAGALERLVQCHTCLAEFETAIGYARRWLALDPLHEPAHRELMRLYTWAGLRAAAVHQYRECIRVLDQELGVPPLEETTQLYQAIKEHQIAPAPPGSWSPDDGRDARRESIARSLGDSPPLPLGEDLSSGNSGSHTAPPAYPLAGRETELAAIVKTYEATRTSGRAIVLEGEAGIGKTRLADALLEHVRGAGGAVIVARCYEGETSLAYAPFAGALRVALAQSSRESWLNTLPDRILAEAARLAPEVITMRTGLPTAPPLDGPGAQIHFFDGISHLLLAACGGHSPGVLFFEDLHWADDASLDLLTYLLRRLRDLHVCMLLTWRTEQMSGANRLPALLTEMERAGASTLLMLGRLSQAAVTELAQAAIAAGAPLPVDTGARLYHETEGLPFFVVEYLDALAKDGPSGDDPWTLPGGVRDLLHSRLSAVSETAWQLLNTAAVIGRSFDFETLREASGRGEEEAITALESLIDQGIVEEVGAASGEQSLVYDFCHEKLRTLVYEETSLARRRLLHRRVAEALSSRARGHRDVGALAGQIAYHYRLAGQESLAADFYYMAGDHARTLYANAEALRDFRSALALGHPNPAALHEAIGDVLTLLGEYGDAVTSYETAAALCRPDALPALEHKLGTIHHRRGEWELAESHFEAALAALGELEAPGERARLYADWSLTAHLYRRQGGEPGTADPWALARRALLLAEAAGDTRALAQVHNLLGVLARVGGDLANAREHLQTSLRLAETLDDPGARTAALNNLARAVAASGEIDRALTLEETALAICVAQGDRHREAALHNNLADLLHAAGRSEEAMPHLKHAVSIYTAIGVEAGTVQPEIWKLAEW